MEPIFFQVLFLSSSIFISFTIHVNSAPSCRPDFCDSTRGPEIRFPFRLKTRQPVRCGYPGFDLYCNDRNQTILDLPLSGEFAVVHIDYRSSSLYINDPGFCLPARSLNFSLSPSSPFRDSYLTSYSLFNCSGSWMNYTSSDYYVPLFCLSGRNSTVVAVQANWTETETEMETETVTETHVPSACQSLTNVSVPLPWTSLQFSWSSMYWKDDFELTWSEPACGECEDRGGICGYAWESGMDIRCSGSKRGASSGLPVGAKYAIVLGIGIPGLTGLIFLATYALVIIRALHRRRVNSDIPTTTTTVTISHRLSTITTSHGLDPPTIESYPKMVLGESRRLPNPNNGVCPICLCEYEPTEILRSIPDCEHYFHAQCIDEWLKLKGTCPLCRNSPESSSGTTPCSSTALSSGSSSTS